MKTFAFIMVPISLNKKTQESQNDIYLGWEGTEKLNYWSEKQNGKSQQ